MQQGNPCQGSDVGDVASSQSVRLRSSNRASRSEFALATHPRSSLQADLWTLCPQRLGDAAEQHDAPQQPPMRDIDLDQRRRRTSWLLR